MADTQDVNEKDVVVQANEEEDGADAIKALEELGEEERNSLWFVDPAIETDAYAVHGVPDSDFQGIVLAHVETEDLDGNENVAATIDAFRTRSDSLEAPPQDLLDEAYDVFKDESKFEVLHEKLMENVFDTEEDCVQVEDENEVVLTLDAVCNALSMPEAAKKVCKDLNARPVENGSAIAIKALAAEVIREHNLDDTFWFVDLGNVQRLHDAWRRALPRVTPHYAVKCNPDPSVIRLLAANGCGFDCASATEIRLVLDAGVGPERIIYAHPSKAPADLRFAAEKKVLLATFDSLVELRKIAKSHKNCELVLRIRADDPGAAIAFGVKFGAMRNEYEGLLAHAAELGLHVVGVSFHVGSMAKNASAFYNAIKESRVAFDMAVAQGHAGMRLLDIGGGFVGRFDSHGRVLSMLGDIPVSINRALDEFFGPSSPFPNVQVISEPGRYFAEGSSSLACVVHSYRTRIDPESGNEFVDYLISDGLYGSFNAVLYDGARPRAWLLSNPLDAPPAGATSDDGELSLTRSNVYGPTCDSMDCVYKNVMLPSNMDVGDWLLFPNFGAYTVAGATNFNGIMAAEPRQFPIVSQSVEESHAVIMWSCEMEEKPSPIVA